MLIRGRVVTKARKRGRSKRVQKCVWCLGELLRCLSYYVRPMRDVMKSDVIRVTSVYCFFLLFSILVSRKVNSLLSWSSV